MIREFNPESSRMRIDDQKLANKQHGSKEQVISAVADMRPIARIAQSPFTPDFLRRDLVVWNNQV
jgi:hypothetical protein